VNQEDAKNMVGWLEAIYKELQETKGVVVEARDKTNMLNEIRDFVSRERGGNGEIDRKIDEAKHHLEAKIDKIEHQMNDLRSILNDIQNKVNHL
jgi:DNA-binding transcriptional MerR regulator